MSVDSYSSRASTPTTPGPISPKDYSIRLITDFDHEEVILFLRKFFFRDEPLNINVKLLEDEHATCLELEQYSVETIKDCISVMAVSTTGQIIGVCLNGIIRKDSPNIKDEADFPEGGNAKFFKIVNMLAYADKMCKIFEKYPTVNKILCVKILSVDGAYRGRGLAKQLMDRTRQIAKEEGFCLMRGDCTSYYSAKALARLGFECIYTLKYADYRVNGEVVFNPEAPHDAFTIYVQEIS